MAMRWKLSSPGTASLMSGKMTCGFFYDGVPLKTHYRADFTCFDRQYIVELKAIKNLTRVEWAQVVHYMRATRTPYGLLLNFGRPQFQYDTFDKGSLPKIFDDRGGLEETSSR